MSSQELLPTDFMKECSWSIDERQTGDNSRDGSGYINDFDGPIWRVNYRFENLTQAAMRILNSFGIRRRFRLVSFTSINGDARAPLLYPSFSNSGVGIASIDQGNNLVSVTSIGNGTILTEGDFLSYKTNKNGFYVGMVTSGVTANGSGNATVPVYPMPMTPHASAPALRLRDPFGEFQLETPWQPVIPSDRRRGVSFSARQVVRL